MFFFFFPPTAPQLRVRIDTERPIDAAIYGRAISALAHDYKKISAGSHLAVAGVEKGSVVTVFVDALAAGSAAIGDVYGAMNSLKTLYEILNGVIQDRINNSEKSARRNSRDGLATCRELAQIAVQSGASVVIEYSFEGNDAKEALSVKIEPTRAQLLL